MNAFLLLAALLAQTDGELKATVVGPKTMAIGQVEQFDAAISLFKSGQSEITTIGEDDKRTTVRWLMANPPPGYSVSKSQKCGTVFFGSGTAGEFTLQLIVSRSTGADTPPLVLDVSFPITVTGTTPKPNPSDPPPPRPEIPDEPEAPEPLPPSALGLYPKIQAAVAALPAAARARSDALSVAYREGATKIAKGEWELTPKSIVPAQLALNVAAMGDQREAWKPVTTVLIDAELTALAKAGKLKTKEDFALAWAEISLGMHLGGLGVK